jgi:hypothetical protein
MKIDHNQRKLNDALGFKDDMTDTIGSIVKRYFVKEEGRGMGHGKASLLVEDIINTAKKRTFNVEDQEVQEYEATLAYLAYVVGLEVAARKQSIADMKSKFVSSLLGGNPIGSAIEEMMKTRRDKPLMGEDNPGSSPKEPIVFKCNSELEEKLFQSVIDSMSKENWTEACQSLLKLKDIKLGGK